MLELLVPERGATESAEGAGPNGEAVVRRPSIRVVVIGVFLLLIVWGIRYAGEVSDAFRLAAEGVQGRPWGHVLDPYFVAKTCPQALLVLLAVVLGFHLSLRWKHAQPLERLVLQSLNWQGRENRRSFHSWRWIFAGLAIVAMAFALLEWIEPYYFVQDDNFSSALPEILQGCRSIAHGEFPDFDPCQLMGRPTSNKCLYPPTFVSYAIARWGLRNENATLEVFALMHLLAGYLASYAAARTAGLRPALAYAMAISFVLSGYILMVGRSWSFFVTLAVWLPLLFCCMEKWLKGRADWRWLFISGLSIGGYYYIGFPQLWFYGMLFLGCTAAVAVLAGRVDLRQLVWPFAATLLGLAMILPTLAVQLEATRGMAEKEANAGKGLEQGLLATVAPFPLTHAEGFMGLPANREPVLETQWYYAGTFLMGCGLLWLGAPLAYRFGRTWWGRHPWTASALLSLWLGLGKEGILWTVIGNLPIVRAVNHHPHRLTPFFIFFSLIVGGVFLERLLRCGKRRNWELWIAAATAVLMLYHVSLSRNSLWSYGDRPYPQFPREIAERVLPSLNSEAGRVWWCGPLRSGLPGFAQLLPLSLPAVYGAYGFGGYDPITESRPETLDFQSRFACTPAEAARAYGVRWILVANPEYYKQEAQYWWPVSKSDWCFGFTDSLWSVYRLKSMPAAELRVRREEVSLYELPDASPMAFDCVSPRVPLAIRFHGWGAEVELLGKGPRTVVANLMMRPWMRAACQGQPLKCSADEWGRMQVEVPDGATQLQILCNLSWGPGCFAAVVLAAATLAGMFLMRIRGTMVP
jgi:hypothetical protein